MQASDREQCNVGQSDKVLHACGSGTLTLTVRICKLCHLIQSQIHSTEQRKSPKRIVCAASNSSKMVFLEPFKDSLLDYSSYCRHAGLPESQIDN